MRSMSSSGMSAKLYAPSLTALAGTPSIITSRWFASVPRTRNWVSEPRAPDWLTATPGKVRTTSESWLKPVARASSPVITVTDEPVLAASIGTRLGEMTTSSGRRVDWALAVPVSAARSALAARPTNVLPPLLAGEGRVGVHARVFDREDGASRLLPAHD